MKSGAATKADAFYVSTPNSVCGVNTINWNGNDWALNCDFIGKDLSNAQVAASQCGPRCLATSGCTHYSYNGVTCWMKSGAATKADAFYVSTPNYVCGVNTVNWNGNDWALNCDFTGQDLSSAQVAAPQCGPRCLATSGCTHYTWNSYNGGTCYMKSGAATKANAFYVSTPNYVCGVNHVA